MSLPFFDALQKSFPQSTVDIIAKDSSIQTVFLHHPGIHSIHSFSKTRIRGLFQLYQYGKSLRKFGPYDMFITLPNSFSSALIGYGTGSPIRAGYKAQGRTWLLTHRFSRPREVHQVYSYLYLVRDLCVSLQKTGNPRYHNLLCPSVESVNAITFPFSEEEQHTTFLNKQKQFKHIVFNVNSEAPSRRLPLNKWVELGNRLINTLNVKLVFIGTASEKHRVAEVFQAIKHKDHVLDLSGKASIRELALLLRDADMLISNNSGPVHLANAVNTPLITFGGAAGRFETEPFNRDHAIVINKHLECSPCWKNVCKFSTVRCLEQITADELYQSVIKILDFRF